MKENSMTDTHRPCIHIRPGGECVEGLLPAVYQAALVHSETHHSRSHHHHTDQSTSAIIYVTVVVVFYVVIIAVLVGTTLRRRGVQLGLGSMGGEEPEDTRHLLLYDDKTHAVTPTPALPASRIHEAGLVTV